MPKRIFYTSIITALLLLIPSAVLGTETVLDSDIDNWDNLGIHEPGLGSWSYVDSLSIARASIAATECNEKIYAFGGYAGTYGDTHPTSAFESYDPHTNKWQLLPPLPEAIGNCFAVTLSGKIYLVGGSTARYVVTNTVRSYLPDTGEWSQKSSMNEPRGDHAGAILNGKIYAVGGWQPEGFMKSVEEYDPATDTWIRKADMTYPRTHHSVAAANGKLYVIGGLWHGTFLNEIDEYDPETDTWRIVGTMPFHRLGTAATVINDKIWLLGGINREYNVVNTVQIFDPVLGTWVTGPPMLSPRSEGGSAIVRDSIYIIGGVLDNNTQLSSVEVHVFDETPPTIPIVSDEGVFTTSTSQLSASWLSEDSESGIAEYQYAIGTSPTDPGSGYVVGWKSAGTATEVTETGLNLIPGTTYYWYVRARNGAGLWSDVGVSDGIIKTSIPPSPTDLVAYQDSWFTGDLIGIGFQWNYPNPPQESFHFEYAIGTSVDIDDTEFLITWTSVPNVIGGGHLGNYLFTEHDVPASHEQSVYLYLRAVNSYSLSSSVSVSNAVIVDATPPEMSIWKGHRFYGCNSWTANVRVEDYESGIAGGRFIYTDPEGESEDIIVPWPDNWGTYGDNIVYLTVGVDRPRGFFIETRNTVGLINKTEYTFAVDCDPPEGYVLINNGDEYTSQLRIHLEIEVWDDISGIYCYGDRPYIAPFGMYIQDSAGKYNTYTCPESVEWNILDSANDGEINILVSVYDRAGNNEIFADSIILDRTPPTLPEIYDGGNYTTDNRQLTASWVSDDDLSGIAEYQYAISTSPTDPGSGYLVDWKSAGTATEVTETSLNLTSGTTYYWYVRAKNGAGLWSEVGASDGILVDLTPPVTPVVTDEGQYTNSPSELSAAWTSEDPDSGIAEYQYAIGTSSTDPGSGYLLDWKSAGTSIEATETELNLTNSQTYYWYVKAQNGAGLWSEVGVSDGILVDLSPPTTPIVTDEGTFTSNTSQLSATWTSEDPETGIAEYQYAIGSSPTDPGSGYLVDWKSAGTATGATETGLSLQNGQTYYWYVKAKNGAGLWSEVGVSDGITVDTSPPTTPIVIDQGDFTTIATQLHAYWISSDPQSGIAEYQYAIGTSPTDPSSGYLVGWKSVGTATEATQTGLSLESGVTYYWYVKAKNGAGLWSQVGISNGITVDTTPPSTPVVTDGGIYTTDSTQLSAFWSSEDPESGITEYQYAIGTSPTDPGSGYTVSWKSSGTATEATETDLNLTNGQVYYWYVRVQNNAGLWSETGVSDGITVDTTPPTTPIVTDDGDYTTDNTQLSASWSSEDPESGIAEFQYAIGTSPTDPGSGYIIGWKSAGTATEATETDLTLTNGQTYYWYVRAQNNAGLWSEVGTSDGILVDTTPPTTPIVTDDGDYTSDSTRLSASWASADPESGIAEFQYAIGTSPTDPGSGYTVSWKSSGTATEATETDLNLTNGQTYYWYVRAQNNAGLWSETGVSDGITVDTTPPATPVVTDEGDYTTDSTQLSASWSSEDQESGITEYRYAIGTSPTDPGSGYTVSWKSAGTETEVTETGLNLQDGQTYYWYVRAQNGAGLWSDVGTSDGILVDSTPPTTPVVSDEGDFTVDDTQLSAIWSSEDPDSGIAEYQYAIGTSPTDPGSGYLVDWKSAGTATEASETNLSLQNGQTYYWYVKALNNAGLWSETGVSDGIVVTVPVLNPNNGHYYHIIPGFVDWDTASDHAASLSYMGMQGHLATITSEEEDQWLQDNMEAWNPWSYDHFWLGGYQDMTAEDYSEPAGGWRWVTGEVWQYTNWKDGNPNNRFYNGDPEDHLAWWNTTNGGWNDFPVYGGITSPDFHIRGYLVEYDIPDTTPPTTPVVTDSGHISYSSSELSASWSATDPESGIAEYRYAIGTSPTDPGSGYVVGWTSSGTATGTTETNLNLQPWTTYYWYVRAQNGYGLWSGTGVSDGITVVPGSVSIGQAKMLANASSVSITGAVVTSGTGQLSDRIYISSPDRSSGIAVQNPGSVSVGDVVDVLGVMGTTVDGERFINQTLLVITSSRDPLSPHSMTLRTLAGGPFHFNPATGTGQRGTTTPPGSGLNTIGQYVEVNGWVSEIDGSFIYINDGSWPAIPGIRVSREHIPGSISINDFVVVRGISSVRRAGLAYQSLIRPRSAQDIQVLHKAGPQASPLRR